jgi:hypothetical protein
MISLTADRLFFDSPAVLRYMDANTARALKRFGSYVRQVAKNRMRSRGGRKSRPGEGPTPQTGLLKSHVLYAYDERERKVIAGPQILSRMTGEVPQLLEEGGVQQRKTKTGIILARFQPRPYMAPAFKAGTKKLKDFYAGKD